MSDDEVSAHVAELNRLANALADFSADNPARDWRVRYVSSGRQYGKQALADAQRRAYEAGLAILREASR